MPHAIRNLETQRIGLQVELDAAKSQVDRNRLGQFATPTMLAREILSYAATLRTGDERVRFLDPAFGTGAFYSALRTVFQKKQIEVATGFEIDHHYGIPARRLWEDSGLTLELCDFTREKPSPRFNLIICNPPYVRHHHLLSDDKTRLQQQTVRTSGMELSGLAGLYCHFLGLSHGWMEEGAIAGWLIPSEFMDVNYGQELKRYLLEKVTLLHIHRFNPNDVQFADALVSSAVVWFRNAPPPKDHSVRFTFGGTLLRPELSRSISAKALAREPKWSRFPAADIRIRRNTPTISEFFQIKRGLATGDNSFFILDAETIAKRGLPLNAFRPVLPSPRYLPEDDVKGDKDGNPVIERRLFLLDTRLSEKEIASRYPSLSVYLEEGKARGLHERYLCSHRTLWYAQESRPAPPIVCTYLGRGDTKRGRPFRFILNESRATVANVYLAMYAKPALLELMQQDSTLIRRIWRVLNDLTPEQLLSEGRVYGGGLHKLEPKELANVDAGAIAALIPGWVSTIAADQLGIFDHDQGDHSDVNQDGPALTAV